MIVQNNHSILAGMKWSTPFWQEWNSLLSSAWNEVVHSILARMKFFILFWPEWNGSFHSDQNALFPSGQNKMNHSVLEADKLQNKSAHFFLIHPVLSLYTIWILLLSLLLLLLFLLLLLILLLLVVFLYLLLNQETYIYTLFSKGSDYFSRKQYFVMKNHPKCDAGGNPHIISTSPIFPRRIILEVFF